MYFKKIILLAITIVYCLSATAQFKLSGKIIDYDGMEELKINIPLVFGFYKENSVAIPVAKDGSFNIVLPIKESKFANLIYKRIFHTLLLNPTKNLTANLRDTTLILTGGTALAENKVMQKVNVEEYPFFLKNEGNNEFAKLPLLQLKERVLKPYFSQRDEKIKIVNTSTLTDKHKLLIITELKSIVYNYINDFARTRLADKKKNDSLIVYVFDHSDKNPVIFPAGPQYFAYVRNYLGYLETKAFMQKKPDQLSPTEKIPYFNLTIDSATKLIKSFGKPYWRWIGANNNLSLKIVEPYTYQEIINLYNAKDLKQMEGLVNAFNITFTRSAYQTDITQKIGILRKRLLENESNTNIKIFDGYEKLSSIYDVIKTLKGKVVYVDVWGTWCGPCKEELTYNPQLKEKFAKQDVAFVYLDMDEEDKDFTWREFIKVNGLTGVHIRKNRKTIEPFWLELLAKTNDKEQYYPQYFIFDKNGNLVVSKANRPSDTNLLYQQIEQYLKVN
ncbi:TlpA family protein disulfide reductase [Pedobacter frigiditerrae]|uniref:TlpA family protein disulfide reductase n=1 Tax=Pedobacter frigiditerrae TaxID=2530452 RepID=A0A4R0MN27_9SPHI|nr:TlpA disulfide reductase family protein [Pedobacter frigiditerrae]TCC88023.1 TlpA family protein disulfide reductase [Pedobacter frigiditerrae]